MSAPQPGVNPGPIDPRVLYDQRNHVSDNIWNGTERAKLKNIGSAKGFNKWKLTDRQQAYVRNAGFGFCLRASNIIKTDASFLNALIERWRPETNTFHLPFGECTITLEDVGMIFGVPVEGEPITGPLLKGKQFLTFIDGFNLKSLSKKAITSSGIRLAWLRETYGVLPEGYTEEQEVAATQAFLLYCIGKVLLPSSKKSYVHARYWRFVQDINNVHKYSWGSGILANTYRQLYKGSRKKAKTFSGCHILIQVWAWERMSLGRANRRPNSDDLVPRITAYSHARDDKYDDRRDDDDVHHVAVILNRGEMDAYDRYHTFEWTPYARLYREGNSQQLWINRELGRCRVPLIHFDTVEYQLPERVLRQFGMANEIPVDPPRFDHLRVEKRDFERVDALQRYAEHVMLWRNNLMQGLNARVETTMERIAEHEAYMSWYRHITRIRINPVIMNPPRGKYYPRACYDQEAGFKTMQLGVDYHRSLINLIPPSYHDVRQFGQSFADAFTKCSQESFNPDFVYPAPHMWEGATAEGESTLDSQFNSLISNLFQTPTQPMDIFKSTLSTEMSKQAPPAPMKAAPKKDKGKGKVVDEDQMFSGPGFDLGMEWTESQGLGDGEGRESAKDQDHDLNLEDENGNPIGYESTSISARPDLRIKQWVDRNWFGAEGPKLKETVKVGREGPRPILELKSLRPGEEIWDSVLSGYIHLLLEREQQRSRDSATWVGDCLFMLACELEWDDWNKFLGRGGNPVNYNFSRSVTYPLEGSDGLQPSITKREFAMIPILYRNIEGGNHFSLFILNMVTMTLVIVDSLIVKKDECLTRFNRQINIVFEYLPFVLNMKLGMNVPVVPYNERRIVLRSNTPKQKNGADCGVFVAKTIDWTLQALGKLPKQWTQTQIDNWRYWMAWEIRNDRARG